MSAIQTLAICQSTVHAQQENVPDSATILFHEGLWQYYHHNLPGAIANYRVALQYDPDNSKILLELAQVLLERGQYAESLEATRHGMEHKTELLPEFYSIMTDSYSYTLLVAENQFQVLERPPEEIELFKKGSRNSEGGYWRFFKLGIAYASLEQFEEAFSNYQQSVLASPDFSDGHLFQAREYHKRGMLPEALMAYARFLMLEPSTPKSVRTILLVKRVWAEYLNEKKKHEESANDPLFAPLTPDQFNDFLQSLNDISLTSVFVKEYYLPYFQAVAANNFSETLYYYIMQSDPDNSTYNVWLPSHKKQLAEFWDWTDQFQWKGFD